MQSQDLTPNARRLDMAEAFARCLRTGEKAAGEAVRTQLSPAVVYSCNGVEIHGRDSVVDRITRQYPFTPVFARGIWAFAREHGIRVRIEANFDHLGAAPRDYSLDFEFDANDQLSRVTETYAFSMAATKTTRMPAHVRSAIDRALSNGTPMVLAYVDEQGAPCLSLRGSVQAWSDHELCAWVRDAASGLVRAVQAGRPLSLLYRDSATRTTLVMRGRGRIATDVETRNRVYRRVPEVEQTHDVDRKGAALIISLDRIAGTHPSGPVLVEPVADRAGHAR